MTYSSPQYLEIWMKRTDSHSDTCGVDQIVHNGASLQSRDCRSGRMEQKQSIFLSHSGAQKASVRRLRNALERNGYRAFFDEDPDSLPKGEPFAQFIKDAARRADVAVVVLSDDFLRSKWPMIELDIFVKEQCKRRKESPGCKELKILPLFMGLSVDEFRRPENRLVWRREWDKIADGDEKKRIDASEWEEALGVLGGSNGMEYGHYNNEEEYIESIVSAIFKLVPPDLSWEDSHVKGKSKYYQAVADMFAQSPPSRRFKSLRVIGLYGMGGMGKTTICQSLCKDYLARFDGKVLHAELGRKSAVEIQKDVLRHLAGTGERVLNHASGTCKEQWQSLLRREMKQKVFLAVDNVWNEEDSLEQAEALLPMGFHPESLVIVTSRSREVLEWLGIHKESCYEMPELDKDDARSVLLHYAAVPESYASSLTKDERREIDKTVERCLFTKGLITGEGSRRQYVPLALKVMGSQLRSCVREGAAILSERIRKLDVKKIDKKVHPVFSVLGLSYDNLPSLKHKSIFRDVALCVPRQRDNTSASVHEVCKWLSMVYGEEYDKIVEVLEYLRKDGLLEGWQDLASPVGMHELYCEFAKTEASKDSCSDEQVYLYHEDGGDVPALMRRSPGLKCWPVSRIHIYNGGFGELTGCEFKHMANVEVLKLEFCFELESLDLRCLKSLRSVELRGCFQLRKVMGLEDLEYLKYIRWNTCRVASIDVIYSAALEIVEIYGSKESAGLDFGFLGACVGLLELTLSCHPRLAAVPDLGKLRELEKVDFSGCGSVEEVRGLEGLCRLKHLNLQGCVKMRRCDGLEKLVKLETLNVEGCERLELGLSWDLRTLVNMRSLSYGGNMMVRELVIGSSQLEQLQVMGCSDLRVVALPTVFGAQIVLSRLKEQFGLIPEPVVFPELTVRSGRVLIRYDATRDVRLGYCGRLKNWDAVCSLTPLSEILLLKVIDLSGCFLLEDLGDLSSLGSLTILNLNECWSLRTVPDLSHSPLLKVLSVRNCFLLRALSLMSTRDVVIDVSECSSLEAMPILELLESVELDVCIGDIYYKLMDEFKAVKLKSLRSRVLDASSSRGLEQLSWLNFLSSQRTDVNAILRLRSSGGDDSGSGNADHEPATSERRSCVGSLLLGLPSWTVGHSDIKHLKKWQRILNGREYTPPGYVIPQSDVGAGSFPLYLVFVS